MKINIDKETGFSIPLAKEFEIFDLFKLKNRTAIITGSANGIGRIAAIALGKAGANIAITDIDFPSAKELEKELFKVDKRHTSDGVSEKINFDDKIKKKIFPVGL